MKRKIAVIIACVTVTLAACTATKYEQSLKALETPARPVRVFVFDPANAAEFPVCHSAFITSINKWAEVVPVHFVITYDLCVWGVRVQYTDVNAPPYSVEHAVGVWYEAWPMIVIDSELESDWRATKLGNFATNTAVHEIGHMLGLPHIHGPGKAFHGDIDVETEELAKKCIMYPANDPMQEIQPLEIALVKEFLNIPKELEHHKGYVTVFMPPPKEPEDATGGNSESSSDV